MSRNDDRLGLGEEHFPQDADTPAPIVGGPTPQTTAEPAFNWSNPTDIIHLPSGGKFYNNTHALHGCSSVEIRYMTAKEEDILTSQTLIKEGVAVDRMLQSLIIDKNIDVNSLLLGDKNALIVASRITGYGPEYTTSINCPGCNSTSEHTFDLEIQEVNDFEAALETHGAEYNDDGNLVVTLPFSKATVECRLLTGHDEAKSFQKNKKRGKKRTDGSSLTDMFLNMMVSVNGDTDYLNRKTFIMNMPARDSRFLRTVYAEATPNIDLSQNFECSECGFEADVEVPLTVDFLWPKR